MTAIGAQPAVPPAPGRPWRADIVTGACTTVAVLTAFGAAYALRAAVGFSAQNVVLAVVLTLTLSRVMTRAQHHPALLAVEIPVVGLAAAGAGWLVVHEPWLGQPLLALALCAGLLARRWGGLARQAGRLVSLPFLALLVTPAPAGPGGPGSELSSILWSPVVGLLAVACAAGGTALVLRERSYAFWAAGVTAMVALLHAFYGDTGPSALRERMLGVLVGSAIGVAAAWFVLPVRTTDALRRRVALCLAALTDDLDPARTEPVTTPAALRALDEVAPAWHGHRRTFGRRQERHPVDVVAALHQLADLPAGERDRRILRRDIVRVRRAFVGKDDPQPAELPAELATVLTFMDRSAPS